MKRGKASLLFVSLFGILSALGYSQDMAVSKVGEWGTGEYLGVFIKGNYAYCAAGGAGLDIIDISSPLNPTRIGNCDTPGPAFHVVVSGSYAYVADGYGGLQIINIANPTSPVLVGSYGTPGYAVDIDISGSYAYVADESGGLQIINIANPAAPFLAGSYDTPRYAMGVDVQGGYAYVADEASGLQIINISNPAAPFLAGSYDTPGSAHGVYVSGSYAYVADELSGLQIINIANPAAPFLAGSYDTPGDALKVYIDGSYAYIADYYGGLQIINIANPAAPFLAGSYGAPGWGYYGVYVSGSYAYLGDFTSGLKIINISNPAAPFFAGSYNESGSAYDVLVSGSYAYMADAGSGLRIINISNPAAPLLAGSYDAPGVAWGVHISGSYAYMADSYAGLKIINISNPAAPFLAGSYDTPRYALGVDVNGAYAYVADEESGLQIINIANPAAPFLAGSYDTPGYARGVYVRGSYAYVADDTSGLQIINISNPAAPFLAGSYDTPGYAEGVFLSGSYAYVADFSSLQIINISNPALPTLAGSYATPFGAYDVYVSGSYAYVANDTSGLQIINIFNPAAPFLAGSYDTPGQARGIYVSSSYAYVADGDSGKLIILSVPVDQAVTSPNGGESWDAGSWHDITWTAPASVGPMKIEYSTDNGAAWTTITTSAPNNGSYAWAVPDTPSTNCLVRVSDFDGSPSDTSDAVFSISAVVSPTITVISPNGGEAWAVGSSHDITWMSTGGVGDVKIEYSTNGGLSYSVIAASTINDGSTTWTVPNTPSTTCLVRISETDGSPQDTSNSTFFITAGGGFNQPSGHIVLPECIWAPATGGGTWVSEVQITDVTGGSTVSAYFSSGGGSRRGPIALWTNTGGERRSIKFSSLLSYLNAVDTGFIYYGKVGAVEFVTQDASHIIQVAARTLNGNYSKTLPGLVLTGENTAAVSRPMMVQNFTNNTTYRSTGGFFNPTPSPLTAEFRLYGGNGVMIGSAFTKSFVGYDFKAFSPFNEAGVPFPTYSYDNVYLLVNPTSGTGSLVGFGASANNNSNDPAAHLAVQFQGTYANSPASFIILPECIWAPATGGGTWVSEVQVTDLTGGSVVSADFDYGGGLRRGPVAIWTNSGGAGRSAKFSNFLSTLQSVDSVFTYYGRVGTVEFVTQDAAHKIQVAARTVNGDYAKTFPGLQLVDSNTAATTREMIIQNYTNNATYRSTCGFFNPTADSVTVEFRLYSEAGLMIGSAFTKTFVGYDFQAFSPFNEAGVPYPGASYDNVILSVKPISGAGRIVCFGASANNSSNDPAAHIALQYH